MDTPTGVAGTRGRLVLLATLVIAMSMALLALPTSSTAQDGQDALPDRVVLFVIDLSGSMNESFDADRSKLDVAKSAFAEAFTEVSPGEQVGVRVYGDQLPAEPPDGRAENCSTDTRLLEPIGPVEPSTLVSDVQGFEAQGDTPIGLALRAAQDDIPEGTLADVVLFSDGRDECFDADLDGDPATGPSYGENPCEVAAEISAEGVDLRVDRIETVGFLADEAAESELRCIADVSGGSYTAVESDEDVAGLADLLAQISSPRPAERLGGTDVEGSETQDGAPDLARLDDPTGSDGRFVDTITMNSERWYRFPQFGPGEVTFTVTAFDLPAQEGIVLVSSLYDPREDDVVFEYSDDDAGVPRRPTSSVRCPGCSYSGGEEGMLWLVSLTSDNDRLEGEFDLELLTEGAGVGGSGTSCEEPQTCWYEQEIEARTIQVEEARQARDEADDAVPDDDLADELAAAQADVDAAQDDLLALQQRLELLDAQAGEGLDQPSYTLPLVLLALGLAAGGASLLIGRRPRANAAGPSMASDLPDQREDGP